LRKLYQATNKQKTDFHHGLLGYWSDTDVKNDPGQTDDETTQGSVGSVNVPAPAPVPEPSSLVMLGSGLIGLIGLRRKLAA
jgi:hypothetical protein